MKDIINNILNKDISLLNKENQEKQEVINELLKQIKEEEKNENR